MHKEAKDKHFIRQPQYEGGPKALKQFIADHIRYPAKALEHGIEGTVYVKYDIDHLGNVVDAKVISGIGYGCDEEAIRLVRLLKFKVERPRGLRVMYHKSLQVHFRRGTVKEEAKEWQINYQPAPAKEVERKEESTGYSFLINFES
jgi:protein TonB